MEEAPEIIPEEIITVLPVREIIMQQNTPAGYNRLDIIVRYLAIENEFGMNDFGWDFYKKMQDLREVKHDSITRFKKLIHSYQQNGYSYDSSIVLDSKLKLLDGSHRLALALFYKQELISCKVIAKKKKVDYTVGWFIGKDFSNNELETILSKGNDILNICTNYISVLLWNPIKDYFDDVEYRLSKLAPIHCSRDITIPHGGKVFDHLISALYSIDDIEEWKIKKKIEYFKDSVKNDEPFFIKYIELRFDYPVYRLKEKTTKTILKQGERIKKIIRELYSTKISNYHYDIIMHTGDNTVQSDQIRNLLYPTFSLTVMFKLIHDYKWCLLKMDSDYITSDFPNTFPFGKDLDLLCDSKDYEAVRLIIISYLKCSTSCYDPLIVKDNLEGCHVRIQHKGNLIYMIDLKKKIDGRNENLIKSIVENRITCGLYSIPMLEDELCVRANEYLVNNKQKHIDYILSNRNSINYQKMSMVDGYDRLLIEIEKNNVK